MLDKMRGHKSNQLLKAFVYTAFGIIILVFAISFGPGSWGQGTGGPGPQKAAVVNGETITTQEFEQAYGQYVERYRQITGQSLSEEQAQALGVRQQILDMLIARELLVQEARKLGVQVSDRDLAQAIRDIPAFQDQGRFDADYYRRYVSNVLGTSPASFEKQLRKDLLRERMGTSLQETVKVAPEEVRARYVEENDKLDLEYVRVSPMQFARAADPTAEAVQTVLEQRPDEVEARYEQNQWRWQTPRRVQVRQVTVQDREEAAGLIAQAQAGEDVPALAQAEAAWHDEGTLSPALEAAVGQLEPGQVVAEPVAVDGGFVVARLEDVQPPEARPFEDVRQEVAEALVREEAGREAAREAAQALLEKARAADQSLEALLGEDDGPELRAARTGLITVSGGYLQGIGRDAELAEKAKALTPEAPVLPEVAQVGDAFYVVRLAERQEPDMERFEAEKDQLAERLAAARAQELEQALVQQLRDGADIQVNEALVAASRS